MSDSTIDPKTRTAAIGLAYFRDRNRFRDTIEAVLQARDQIPGFSPDDLKPRTEPYFIADVWRFTFAGVPFQLKFVPQAVGTSERSAIAFTQMNGDDEVTCVGGGEVTFDAGGRTGGILEDFTLPGDAVAMFHTLIVNRFENLKL